jgi:hypothetical protein
MSRVKLKKTCIHCYEEKPLSDFGNDEKRCRRCRKAYDAKRYASFSTKKKTELFVRNKENNLKRLYNISTEDWQRLFKEQNGACALCLKKMTNSLHVDHCHGTGRVRGLLCMRCNSALGTLGDTPMSLYRVLEYVCG